MGRFLLVVSAALVVVLFTKSGDVGAAATLRSGSAASDTTQGTAAAINELKSTLQFQGKVAKQSENIDPLTKECPKPFVNIIGQCFYITTKVSMNFDHAREFCRGMGGDLAQPTYPHALMSYILDTIGGQPGCQFPFIFQHVRYSTCTEVDTETPGRSWCSTETKKSHHHIKDKWQYCEDSNFWIGGSDRAEEGTWRWLAGGTLSGEEITKYWLPGQPNNHEHGQDCLSFRAVDGYFRLFGDRPCETEYNFICEYKRLS